MIFKNPGNLSDEEMEEFIVGIFRALRSKIYAILPEECLLKPKKILTGLMFELVDTDCIDSGSLGAKDVCSLCFETECPYNNIPDRAERVFMLEVLKKAKNRESKNSD